MAAASSQNRMGYELVSVLAAGGMGTVFLGVHRGSHGFERPVAIKEMHPHLGCSAEFREMFLAEARLVAEIRHPNVVPTIDIVAEGHSLRIVMEYVDGATLRQVLNAGGRAPLRPPVAAAILRDVLHGLHAAHEATNAQGENLGIIHRDISPANVILGRDGQARIIDFGVAKSKYQKKVTVGRVIKGKVAYMPPEQLSGNQVDRRADIFAAAVVLWELLTGKRLFASDRGSQHEINDVIPPPSTIVPAAAGLDAIVMRGLAPNRDDRYATALEMLMALEAAIKPASRVEVMALVDACIPPRGSLASLSAVSLEIASGPTTLAAEPTTTVDPEPTTLSRKTIAAPVSLKAAARYALCARLDLMALVAGIVLLVATTALHLSNAASSVIAASARMHAPRHTPVVTSTPLDASVRPRSAEDAPPNLSAVTKPKPPAAKRAARAATSPLHF